MNNGLIKIKFDRYDIVLKVLATILLVAAILKGHELLTVPMANDSIWTNRWFMIFQVEFELALSIWLFSGLFKRLAWLAALGCFSMFCCVTLYKGLTGADSCGCFGVVHVNPWITLFAMDLPAVIVLTIWRPEGVEDLFKVINLSFFFELLHPWPRLKVLAGVFAFGILAVSISSAALVIYNPENNIKHDISLDYKQWVGKEIPFIKHIDVKDQLVGGKYIVVFYRSNCSLCKYEIPKYEKLALELDKMKKNDNVKIALIELPPYAKPEEDIVSHSTSCVLGKLIDDIYFPIRTPLSIILENGIVVRGFEGMSYR